MLTTFEDILVMLLCTGSSLLFLWILKRFWPSSVRRVHNEIIGWQVSVLGTTYAVVIGFMLFAVWTSFQSAEVNADSEANCLVNVYRLANGLPASQRVQVHQIAREYADYVLDHEWPTMIRGELDLGGSPIVERLWAAALQTRPSSLAEQTTMNVTLAEITSMTERRRDRQLDSQRRLPGILWMLLILGGGVTILSSCLFGTDNFALHAFQVVSLTLLLSLSLVVIADIDRPYQGSVHVEPHGFERARATFARIPPDTP